MSVDSYQYERAIKYMFGDMDAEFWRRVVDERLTPPLMLLEHVMAQRDYIIPIVAENKEREVNSSKGDMHE